MSVHKKLILEKKKELKVIEDEVMGDESYRKL